MITFPKYVEAFIDEKRITSASLEEQCEAAPLIGYAFRLYRRDNYQWFSTTQKEADRLVAWAKRNYAEAYRMRDVTYTDKEHRKPYYKRDYILLVITDPVAILMEKRIKAKAEADKPKPKPLRGKYPGLLMPDKP